MNTSLKIKIKWNYIGLNNIKDILINVDGKLFYSIYVKCVDYF